MSGSVTSGGEMSSWSPGMVVRKVPSVPVITSVSVSPQSQGGFARLYFQTDNSDLCQVKLIGQNELISEAGDSGPSCSYQERLISFSLATLPCQDHSVTVRCRNRVPLDKVILLRLRQFSTSSNIIIPSC